jgi:hypothetical protein
MKSRESKSEVTGHRLVIKCCLAWTLLIGIVCVSYGSLPSFHRGMNRSLDSAGLALEAAVGTCLNRELSPSAGTPTKLVAFLSFSQNDMETAPEVFSQRSYPWYDQESDRARPLELGERTAPKSADRNNIRLSKPTGNTSGGGGRGGGGGSAATGLSAIAWIGVAVLIGALAALLVWAFFKIESRSRRNLTSSQQRTLAESIEHLPFQIDENSGDFRALADRAGQAGDYRKAIVFLFSHVLVTLDQNHLIRLRNGKTNRQYLAELKHQRSLGDFYQNVMEPFESVFFGDHDLTREAFAHCWRGLEQFQNDVDFAVQSASTNDHPDPNPSVQVVS